jgi:hypothetical protein
MDGSMFNPEDLLRIRSPEDLRLHGSSGGFEDLNLITRRWKRHNLLIFRRQISRLRAFCAPIEDSACEKVKIQDLTPFAG